MADAPVRVLQVVTQMTRGGLETMLMNYYRHIDRSKVQFDFIEHRDRMVDYDAEILEMGGKIYRLPRLNPFSGRYLRALDRFFAEHPEYRIVHSHLDCMAGIPLKYAKKHGVPVRIAHAHNSSQEKNLKYPLKLIYKRNIPVYASDLFACSKAAGEWMFGTKEFTVLNNAIDANAYVYNEKTRQEVRDEFGIDPNTLVVGHVGRFMPQKNHTFLIDVFCSLLQKQADARLMLVGTGDLQGSVLEQCKKKDIQEKVIFTGVRNDVNRLLQAMDIFVLPSLWEGLGIVAVEAQAAGLPCIVSDRVPNECVKTEGLVHFLPLDTGAEVWAQDILRHSDNQRIDRTQEIERNGFDIRINAEQLQKFYLDAVAAHK